MGKEHHLRMLQMGESGQDGAGMGGGLPDQRALKGAQFGDQQIDLVAQVEPDVQRDLVVATAGGVDPRPFGAERIDERALDVHVDVFHRNIAGEVAGFDAPADVVQLGANRLRGRFGNDSLRGKHLHMSLAALDIVFVEPFVERDRLGIAGDLVSSRRTESSAPERHEITSRFAFPGK